MSTVIANMSMSLDGFIEDRDGGVKHLFGWYESGKQATTMPGDEREFRTSSASATELREAVAATGALICGRPSSAVDGHTAAVEGPGCRCVGGI